MEKARILQSHFLEDGSGKKYFEYAGSSEVEKPVNDLIATGSLFHEVDSTKVYAYNEASEEWIEQIQFGGGDSESNVISGTKSVKSVVPENDEPEEGEER